MQTRKLVLPAISVGLIVTSRPASASPIDLGVVADKLILAGTLPMGATLNTYTFSGVQDVYQGTATINGQTIDTQTIDSILNGDIGPPLLTLTFNFAGSESAHGGATITTGNLTLTTAGDVGLSPAMVPLTITSCTANTPGFALPNCTQGAQGVLDLYSPADVAAELAALKWISPPGDYVNTGATLNTNTVTYDLGSVGNTVYQGEVVETTESVFAAATPEPASWSVAALGVAVLGWLRRRSRRG